MAVTVAEKEPGPGVEFLHSTQDVADFDREDAAAAVDPDLRRAVAQVHRDRREGGQQPEDSRGSGGGVVQGVPAADNPVESVSNPIAAIAASEPNPGGGASDGGTAAAASDGDDGAAADKKGGGCCVVM